MRILLIRPRYRYSISDPPLGLGYIAAVLEKQGHNVKFLDLTRDSLSNFQFKEYVRREDPELVGITLTCSGLLETQRLVALIREITQVPIVLGGPQPSVMPIYTLEKTKANYVVISEGDETIQEVAEQIEKGSKDFSEVQGLAYVGGNGLPRLNESRKLIENLDEIPFPAWHLMEPAKYLQAPILTTVKKYPIAPIITSRGCPYECAYCSSPTIWGRRLRVRSSRNVVDEIELLMNRYGVKEIFVSDDNFTLIKKHAMSICNEILERKIDISWACPNGVRVDQLDDELISTMAKAGCHLLGFGIESGSQEILNGAKKHLDLSIVPDVLKKAKKSGMMTYGFFILGLPGENSLTIRQTIDFAKRLSLDRAWFNILVPYPGTPIFDVYVQRVGLENIDWDNIDTSAGIIARGLLYEDLDEEKLQSWQRRAVREFYFRPRIMLSLLRNIRYRQIKASTQRSFFRKAISKL